nr:MAG TPA: dUTPase [Caudoviricetes sp.]
MGSRSGKKGIIRYEKQKQSVSAHDAVHGNDAVDSLLYHAGKSGRVEVVRNHLRHSRRDLFHALPLFVDRTLKGEKKMKVVIDPGCYMPERAHEDDAGLDLRTPHDVVVPSFGSAVIDTGVHMQIPVGMVGMLKSKSGLNVKSGITSEGVIDAGYTGSIIAKLYNHSGKTCLLKAGSKVTQIVILPVIKLPLEVVDKLDDSERGSNGFGSSGV